MKKVIGILSIILCVIIELQSLLAGLGNTLANSKESSGSVGFLVGILMLTAGIIVLCSKHSRTMVITSIVFYIIGAICGFAGAGSYSDLNVWSGVGILFSVLLIVHLTRNKEIYLNGHTM